LGPSGERVPGAWVARGVAGIRALCLVVCLVLGLPGCPVCSAAAVRPVRDAPERYR